jgi:hypothetical protein
LWDAVHSFSTPFRLSRQGKIISAGSNRRVPIEDDTGFFAGTPSMIFMLPPEFFTFAAGHGL